MLIVRSLDCQSRNIHLDVVGYGEPAQVVGRDSTPPGRPGRFVRNRRKDAYRFTLEGFVEGFGDDRDESALDWRVNFDQLMAVMDFSLDPGPIEIGPDPPARFPDAAPYLGLTVERTLDARCVSIVRGPVRAHMSFQNLSFEMECVDNPPGWVDLESS